MPFDTRRGRVREHGAPSTRPSLIRQSSHSLALVDAETAGIVNDLLAQRSKARSSGNYAKSDAIRDRLYESYNIRIDDRLGEWSVGGNFGSSDDHWTSTNKQQLARYTKSEMSANLPESDERYIQRKVDERMRAKRTRNYDLSDSIRDKLYDVYDVTIHDKMNLWSVGGDFGEGNSWNHNINLAKRDLPEDRDDEFDSIDNSLVMDHQGSEEMDSVSSSHEKEASTSTTREQLERLTVVQLKEKLRNSGLTVSGTKAKLISRLLDGKTNV